METQLYLWEKKRQKWKEKYKAALIDESINGTFYMPGFN